MNVQQITKLIEDEKKDCAACQRGDLPSHFAGYLTGGAFRNNGCLSSGRHFNANKGAFVGRTHCTCDTCF